MTLVGGGGVSHLNWGVVEYHRYSTAHQKTVGLFYISATLYTFRTAHILGAFCGCCLSLLQSIGLLTPPPLIIMACT